MGVMNKMRENTATVLWILVISFGLIWVLQDAGTFESLGNRAARTIAEVDGEDIPYEEYARQVEQYFQFYQQQTGQSPPPQTAELYRQQAFDDLINARLIDREIERMGIEVSDSELYDMIFGPNPDPWILQTFGDGKGGVDYTRLQSFVESPEWPRIEEFLRNKRKQEKLQNILTSLITISDEEVLNEYIKRNKKVDARYVALRYADIPDDSVEVTERDLRRFYNQHKDEFKQPRTYTIEYVAIPKTPSREDTLDVLEELESLKEAFAKATDDSLFLSQYGSEQPYSGAYFKYDELDRDLAEAIFKNPKPGTVIGPIIVGNKAHLVKIEDVRPAEEPVIHARHILLGTPRDTEAEKKAARKQALELKRRIEKGEDFAQLAREYSRDPGTAPAGGDLGWFGKGQMVKPFEDAAFKAPVGKVVGPVETRFGYHLIEVLGKANQEVKIADFVREIRPSVRTLNELASKAEDLQYFASESGNFSKEAQQLGLQATEVVVQEGQQFIPGIGSSQQVMDFLKQAKEGKISDVIELNDKFVVVLVKDIQPEGFRPFEEVRAELEPRVKLEKKKEIQVKRLQEAYNKVGGYDSLAAYLGVPEYVAREVNFNNTLIPGLGREPKFVGAVLGLKEGQDTGVIAGNNAAFVAKVIRVQEPDLSKLTEAKKEELRQELLRREQQKVLNQWLQTLRKQAKVEDYRYRFTQA